MHTVTFLSDFMLSSGYVSQMKGVVSSFLKDVNMIDISHFIPPQDVAAGAFVLKTAIPFMPVGSVHVGVVDPGVGTNRRGIVIVTNKHIFVGPDNGLFLPAARLFGVFRVYEITNESLFQHPVSSTFHGRDIFASVAGHILKGISFDEIGSEIHDYVDLSLPQPTFEDKTVTGEVLFIDDFGNSITCIEGNRFLQQVTFDEQLIIHIGEKTVRASFVKAYGVASKNEVLVTIGSHGYLELSVNQGKANEKLGLKRGDLISIDIDSSE